LAAAPPFGQALAQKAGSAGATMSFVTQQPANEWLTRVFIGQAVHNAAGETVGDIKDLVFNHKGQISTAVIGVQQPRRTLSCPGPLRRGRATLQARVGGLREGPRPRPS
jgi:sporulation protein YlmC with PRC-barrel domain